MEIKEDEKNNEEIPVFKAPEEEIPTFTPPADAKVSGANEGGSGKGRVRF